MKICGLKLTHDSSIAVIDEGKLVFSVELEKVKNNPRYFIINNLNIIPEILSQYDYKIEDIDQFVIDGWVGEKEAVLTLKNNQSVHSVVVSPYHEKCMCDDMMAIEKKGTLCIDKHEISYISYPHVMNHISSVYCTSPFSAAGESSYILIWDGGMYPRLYYYDVETGKLSNMGSLFYFGVNMYSIFSQHFRPYKLNTNVIKDELSIAGKVMAYSSLGTVRQEIVSDLEMVYSSTLEEAKRADKIPTYPYLFSSVFIDKTANKGYVDEDIIASFQEFIENKLITSLGNFIKKERLSANFCFAGGAALNIKWNSAIKKCDLFDNVWICPFPNDSGSAIGAACSFLLANCKQRTVEWNVYSGPALIQNDPSEGWTAAPCSISELAELVFRSNEPVIILNDKAELGPRALGNRSIIANPFSDRMKDIFNNIKLRESYRPIAPICIEERAGEIFDPGWPDQYMLYNHTVREEWLDRIPAIKHIDKTARLQTVSQTSNWVMYKLLLEYEKLSGIPVLCNSSANYKGSGFFPDIFSASKWGKVNYIWCNNTLYENIQKVKF